MEDMKSDVSYEKQNSKFGEIISNHQIYISYTFGTIAVDKRTMNRQSMDHGPKDLVSGRYPPVGQNWAPGKYHI